MFSSLVYNKNNNLFNRVSEHAIIFAKTLNEESEWIITSKSLIDYFDKTIEEKFYANNLVDAINHILEEETKSINIVAHGSAGFIDLGNGYNSFTLEKDNFNFLIDSDIYLSGSFESPVLGGFLSFNNGFINLNITNQNNKKENNLIPEEDKKDWPELYWNNNENIEIISNETILNSVLLGETLPNYLDNLSFNNLKLKLGPDFKLQYSELVQAYLDTKLDLNIKGKVGKDLNARGLIYLKKGRANLYTTPFKLDKNKDNYILFASRSGVVPFINFSLVSKVPDSKIPISENNQDSNISNDVDADATTSGFGTFGIGNTRLIKIEASYEGFLDQLSFEDENKRSN